MSSIAASYAPAYMMQKRQQEKLRKRITEERMSAMLDRSKEDAAMLEKNDGDSSKVMADPKKNRTKKVHPTGNSPVAHVRF